MGTTAIIFRNEVIKAKTEAANYYHNELKASHEDERMLKQVLIKERQSKPDLMIVTNPMKDVDSENNDEVIKTR